MIKMVVFDMAGTTVDEDNIVYKTLLKTINDAGYDFTLAEVLATGAGKEKLTAIKDIIALSGAIPLDQLSNKIYTSFTTELAEAYNRFELQPQPGAEELFAELKKKNILVVLNTGYNEITAAAILDKLGWKVGVHIDALVTASDVTNNRPQPDMILLAMQQFDITDGHEVIKVGDSIIDIEEGKNAGCHLSIGITTGAHNYEQLASAAPDHIINHLSELLPLI
ncbi:phosphonatase-like hydrolase [Ferruginibacter profundus]